MAFAGSVLTKSGWTQPKHGIEIACADNGKLVWKTITAFTPLISPAVSVKSRDIRYTASPDQKLYQYSGRHLRVGEVWMRHHAAKGRRLNVNHRLALEMPDANESDPGEIMQILASVEMPDGNCPNTRFHQALHRYLRTIPVLSSGWERKIIGMRVLNPAKANLFDMDHGVATQLFRFGLAHDMAVCLNSLTSDMLQWAAVISGHHAVIRSGRVVYSKRKTRPVCINKTCNLEVVGSEMAVIDVDHPFVREDGRITIL